MKLENLIRIFIEDIYFKDTVSLKQDFIYICDTINNKYFMNCKDENKFKKIMEELFYVFSTNDFILMADYLEYELMHKISTVMGSE